MLLVSALGFQWATRKACYRQSDRQTDRRTDSTITVCLLAPPRHNNHLLASLTLTRSLVLLYISTTNRSSSDIADSLMLSSMRRHWNAWVTSGKTLHVFQAVFLPIPNYFQCLLLMEDDINESAMSLLVVLIYNRTSDLVSVNDARRWLFTQKSRLLESREIKLHVLWSKRVTANGKMSRDPTFTPLPAVRFTRSNAWTAI